MTDDRHGDGITTLATAVPDSSGSSVAAALATWPGGVVYQIREGERFVTHVWWWRSGITETVHSDAIPAVELDVVGSAVVGQTKGRAGLWVTALHAGTPSPALPEEASRDGVAGSGSPTHLAWQTSTNVLEVSTLRAGRFGPPTRLAQGEDIYATIWMSDCWLAVRRLSGLFAYNLCASRPGRLPLQLLSAAQAGTLFNPGRLSGSGGKLAFALAPAASGPETLIVISAPT